MNRRDKGLLITGIFVGAAIAGAVYGVRQYLIPPAKTSEALPANGAVSGTTLELPTADSASDSAIAIALTADEQRSIGMETTEVRRQTILKEILVPGRVAEAETGIGAISARISGRIEKLFVNVTGESVSRGQPIASIYSPDLFASAEEYKLALENRQRLSASRESQALMQADQLIQASRRRLELWGLTAEQIDAIPSASSPAVQNTIYSSMAGVITKRNVGEGQYVKEGDILYTVTDLSTVWVQAEIFESDIPAVRSGMDARITSPALAGGVLRGTIDFLQPSVDPQTRTMNARIQVPNPGMRLRPGMFVQVSFKVPLASNTVAVPREAVLNTGRGPVVYVATENGVFVKRSIEADAAGDDYYSVRNGLRPGERVVTKGNFLIDSQSRLAGNITGMFGGSRAFGTEIPSSQVPSQNYSVTLRTEPSAPKGGADGMFYVIVTGSDGKPVADAQVKITLLMPAMPAMGMGEMRSSIDLTWNGSEYTGSGPIAMAGSWNVSVEASRNGQLLGVFRSRFDAK